MWYTITVIKPLRYVIMPKNNNNLYRYDNYNYTLFTVIDNKTECIWIFKNSDHSQYALHVFVINSFSYVRDLWIILSLSLK